MRNQALRDVLDRLQMLNLIGEMIVIISPLQVTYILPNRDFEELVSHFSSIFFPLLRILFPVLRYIL